MERLRFALARLALVATTVTMALTSFAGTAQAAAIAGTSDILSNNQINALGISHTIAFTTASSAVSKCYKLTFDANSNLTGTTANIYADWSNTSGGNQVTTGTTVYTTGAGGNVKIPFTGTLDATRIVTFVVSAITNGATAGTGYTVTIELYPDATCTTGPATDTGTATYNLIQDRVTQNVGVAQALQWVFNGNTTHEYRVDPVNNPTDSNSNSMTVRTNADAYTVRVRNTQALTGTNGGTSWTGGVNGNTVPDTFGGTDGAPTSLNGGGGQTGFGYNIGTVNGSTKAAYGANTYAAFQTAAFPGTNNIVMQRAGPNTPTGNTADGATITYKVGVDWTVEAGYYTTTTIYQVTPTYN